MQLVAAAPIDKRAAAPVKTGPEADRLRLEYLQARGIVQTIADRSPDYLSIVERRAAIEDLRVRASVDPMALAELASELEASVDTKMMEMTALMDAWRVALRHPCPNVEPRGGCDLGWLVLSCGSLVKGMHDTCLGYPRPTSTLAGPCIIIETSYQPERVAPESRRTPAPEYGPKPEPPPNRLIYDDTRLREIVQRLAPCRRRGDGLAYESEMLGDLWQQGDDT